MNDIVLEFLDIYKTNAYIFNSLKCSIYISKIQLIIAQTIASISHIFVNFDRMDLILIHIVKRSKKNLLVFETNISCIQHLNNLGRILF